MSTLCMPPTSLPEQKALPAPVTSTARTFSSVCNSEKMRVSSRYMSSESAFIFSGLSSVTACADSNPTGASAARAVEIRHHAAHGGGAVASSTALREQLASARAATARYQRVEAAVADGYVDTGECVALPGVGGMGVHFVNVALMGDADYDPARPEVLVYEPRQNGSLRLVAVEYLIFRAPWEAAHAGTTPAFAGVPFDESFGEAAHGLPDHYELHAWTWQHNPLGMFAPFNPRVSCR